MYAYLACLWVLQLFRIKYLTISEVSPSLGVSHGSRQADGHSQSRCGGWALVPSADGHWPMRKVVVPQAVPLHSFSSYSPSRAQTLA